MFAVILLPSFRLQATLRFREEMHARPVALIDPGDPKGGVLEMNDAAESAGVKAGQTSTQALSRCPTLAIVPRSPTHEHSAQSALLEIAGTLSPEVEATADGFCTVNLRGTREMDLPALGSRVVSALAPLHLRAQVGIAANPDLAFIAARHARPVLVVNTPQAFLADLALHELNPAPDLLAVLGDWGIHNLAQLTSLPQGDIMDRLGTDAARLWERATGCMERPLRIVRAVEEFSESSDFEHEVETVGPVLFIVRRFLDQLAARLGNVHRVAGRMTLTLTLANGAAHERTFTVPSPTADVEVLFRILHTHLDGLRLAHGATGARLRIEPAQPERQQFQLFESPLRDPNRFGETLGRIAAIVGAENAGVARIIDTHRPDSFRLDTPRFHEIAATDVSADFATGLPLRRWRPPVHAAVRLVRHRPAFIQSARVRGTIRDALGPYRASGAWWERDSWASEEWDIETDGGGLYRIARAGDEWRIEGGYEEPPAIIPHGACAIVPMPPHGG